MGRLSFNKIYIITLDHSQENYDLIADKLSNLGLSDSVEYKIVKGHNGSKDPLPDDFNVYDNWKIPSTNEWYNREVSDSEIGCAISHINCWRNILKDNVDAALILEDDVEISNLDLWPQAVVCLPHKNKWDVLYLGYQNKNHIMPLPVLVKWRFIYPVLNFLKIKRYNLKKIRLTFDRLYNKHWIQLGAHNGAYAYLVNKNAAKKIIEYNTPLFVQADVVLMDLIIKGKINAFGLSKTIFEPNFEIQSSIGNRTSWEEKN